MRRLFRSIIVVVLCASAAGVPSLAQERTTTFVHGLGSSPATWDTAVSELAPPLAIRPLVADLEWQAFYESQASELERELGGQVPADGIAVGHSNGGLVSRQWSRLRPLGGLITVGSPNQGAPIVDHIFDWLGHLDDVLNRIDLVNAIFVNDVDIVKWWWLPAQWKTAFADRLGHLVYGRERHVLARVRLPPAGDAADARGLVVHEQHEFGRQSRS